MEKCLLVTTVKNEGPNILEWVAHHRLCGFDHIQIYQNDSTDTTANSLKVLDRLGVIEYHANWHPRGAHQMRAYRRAARSEAYRDCDWCMVLDGDEFLNVKVGRNKVHDLIAACQSDADAILVNWKIFGSSHKTDFSDQLISERFTLAEDPNEITTGTSFSPFKPLFRTSSYQRLGIHLPRIPQKPDPKVYNGSGLADGEFHRINWRGQDPLARKYAQVNHYIVRDLSSFLLKHARGSANNPSRDVGLKYWNQHNRNDAPDVLLADRRDSIWEEMKRLDAMSDGKLFQLRRRAQRQWRLALEELSQRSDIADLKDAILTEEAVS